MTTRGAQMQSFASADSTLSTNDDNDTISFASTSSLEYEARLSNARIGGGIGGLGGANGGGAPSSAADRDMTEDEVAVMVRNALRKARRAMNNCSPTSGDGGGGDDPDRVVPAVDSAEHSGGGGGGGGGGGSDLDSLLPRPTTDEINFGSLSIDTAISRDSSVVPGPGRGGGARKRAPSSGSAKSDIARRIEEEIQSARNYAQLRYDNDNGGGDDEQSESRTTASPPASPPPKGEGVGGVGGVGLSIPTGRRSSGQTVDSQTTPLVSNGNRNASAASGDADASPTNRRQNDATRERIARSKDRIAAATERLSRLSPAPHPGVRGGGDPLEMGPDPLNYDREEMAAAEGGGGGEGGPADRPSATGEGGGDAVAGPGDGHAPAPPVDDGGDNPPGGDPANRAARERRNVLAPNVQILHSSNKPPLSNVSSPGGGLPPPPPPPGNPSPQNTNSSTNKPRHHRQVLFRHPYPLPPPPPLPRGDVAVISSHSAPDKDVHFRWVRPDNDLEALIEAAGEEENLIRRSNACGAIKVLASKESNQQKLCRTVGLLDVLVRACWDDAVDSDAFDARTRAVTTMLYLAEPRDNRLVVARHPQALDALVKVVEEDTGEARWRATSTLATLAKTPGNRVLMGGFEKLATVMGDLMVVGAQQQGGDVGGEGGDDEKGGHENDNAAVVGIASKASQDNRSIDDGSSLLHGRDSSTRGRSFDTNDDSRMLTHTYSGTETFTDGSASHTDDGTYASVYDSDLDDGQESDDESHATRDSYDEASIAEEGVEMQISSLKKQNIENASDFLAKSQMSACATLLHLTKNCANAPIMCKNAQLLDCIVFLAGIPEHPLHTRCIEIICNLSRFPSNNARLAANPKCVDTLLHCGKSKIAEDRMWAVRTIQNLCSDASSKVTLATGPMLSVLSTAAMRKDYEEQFAAVGALMNLSTEPGSIVPLTNTKTVVATLVHLAHSPNTPSAVRKIACDSLATIGLWLQTLASAGTVPEEIPFSPLPTHSATGWLRWDNA